MHASQAAAHRARIVVLLTERKVAPYGDLLGAPLPGHRRTVWVHNATYAVRTLLARGVLARVNRGEYKLADTNMSLADILAASDDLARSVFDVIEDCRLKGVKTRAVLAIVSRAGYREAEIRSSLRQLQRLRLVNRTSHGWQSVRKTADAEIDIFS